MRINKSIINTAVKLVNTASKRVEDASVSNPLVKTSLKDVSIIKDAPLLRTPLTKKQILEMKPSEFKALLESRTEIPKEVAETIENPAELGLYDTLNNLLLEKHIPLDKRKEILTNFIRISDSNSAREVVPKLAAKGYDVELLSKLPIDEMNKDVIEQVLNNRKLIDNYVRAKVPVIENVEQKIKATKEEIANLKKQANCDEFELFDCEDYLRKLNEYVQGIPQKKAEVQFLTDILYHVDKNNIKYLSEYFENIPSEMPHYLHYWKSDTTKIFQKWIKGISEQEPLDRIYRKGHNYESIQKIFGDKRMTNVSQRLLEYKNFDKYKDIDLANFDTLSIAERKEFIASYIQALTPKQTLWDKELLANFDELSSKMKIYKGFDTTDTKTLTKSYQDTLKKMLDSLPEAERKPIQQRINYGKYKQTYRDANPIPALVDDLSKLPFRKESFNGKTYKVIEMPYDNPLCASNHRMPNGDSIINIEALEATNPQTILCVGQKGGSRGMNIGGDLTYSLFVKPRKGNDLWLQSYSDIDSGNDVTKNIYNVERRCLRHAFRRSHVGKAFEYVPELIKKELNLSQKEYIQRMKALKDCTTLDEIGKINKEFEQAIRNVLKNNNMYEGIGRFTVMGIKIPNKPISEINENILSYAQRKDIPLVRITK